MSKQAIVALTILALGAPCAAVAAERVLQLRTLEDPNFPPDRSVCAATPFTTTVFLGASVWSYGSRASDGTIVNIDMRQVGTATGCAGISSLAALAPFGTPLPFMLRLNLADGSYTGYGWCTITSDSVPVSRVFLAGCTLEVIDAPPGVHGGVLSSASVFNPFRVPGLETGSYWTLRLYTD